MCLNFEVDPDEAAQPRMPQHVALVDDDALFTENLARHLREMGVSATVFADGADFLASADPYGFDFYVLDLMLPSVDGVSLIDVLRRRSSAGILVVSGRLGADTFRDVVRVGADMYLGKPAQLDQICIAMQAVHRRVCASLTLHQVWRLDRRAAQLIAPDGARIELSAHDQALIERFARANGDPVSREELSRCLGKSAQSEGQGGLNGTIFRLRRRIERASSAAVPVQAKSGVGYAFKAPLKVI